MSRQTRSIWLILTLLLVASVAVAGGPDCQQRLVIIGEDGDHAVHEFDFSCLESLIDEAVTSAVTGLESALEDLEREEISIHMDDADQIVISYGDRMAAFNLEVLAAQLEQTLAHIHVDLERELGAIEFVDGADEQDEAEQLREELDNLKAELGRLRSDLQRVH